MWSWILFASFLILDSQSETLVSNNSWRSQDVPDKMLPNKTVLESTDSDNVVPDSKMSEDHIALTLNIPASSLGTLCSCPQQQQQRQDNIEIPQYYIHKLREECESQIRKSVKEIKQMQFHEASVRIELEQRFFILENTTRFLESFYKESSYPTKELLQHMLNRLHLEKLAREDLQQEVIQLQNQIQAAASHIDCEYIKRPGVYNIRPLNTEISIPVFCDRGWTVIQRRFDGTVDFYRDWQTYAKGFGELQGEFWLGNTNIHLITTQAKYRLQVLMTDWQDNNYQSEYDHFWIDGNHDNYRLHVTNHHGNIKDGFIRKEARHNHNNMPFSTYDKNNQPNKTSYCAEVYHGAWWYNSCYASNLNGRYCKPTGVAERAQCMVWWGDDEEDRIIMKSVTMRIRENHKQTIFLEETDEILET